MVDTNERHEARRRRVEIRTGVERRRRWTAEEKGRIVAEAVRPGVVLAEVARRYALAPQHLSNWIRAAKDGHFALPAGDDDRSEAAFVPVVSSGSRADGSGRPATKPTPAAIEIELAGAVIRVKRGADPRLVSAVLRALRAGGA
jgi:transposase